MAHRPPSLAGPPPPPPLHCAQVLSVTETQYTGADIAFISPDSENLSVLQAAVLGADLRRHQAYSLAPGEARLLRLAEAGFDTQPRQFACRRPPACN